MSWGVSRAAGGYANASSGIVTAVSGLRFRLGLVLRPDAPLGLLVLRLPLLDGLGSVVARCAAVVVTASLLRGGFATGTALHDDLLRRERVVGAAGGGEHAHHLRGMGQQYSGHTAVPGLQQAHTGTSFTLGERQTDTPRKQGRVSCRGGVATRLCAAIRTCQSSLDPDSRSSTKRWAMR